MIKHSKKTLPSGLRIITVPIKDNPAITVLTAVGVGSDHETKNLNGLSHFLEHMCFKGTEKRPTALHISKELDSIGAESNAFTSNEFTGYYAKAHPKHLDKLVDVVSDIYLNSVLPEKEIEKEKGVIVEEINLDEDQPVNNVWRIFMSLLYKDQPAGRSILGTKRTVKSFKRKHFEEYRSKYYSAPNTVIIISGQFDQKKAEQLIGRTFKGIDKRKVPKKTKTVDRQKVLSVKAKYKKTDQAHLMLGVRTFPAKHKDSYILEVLNTVLGGGMSSRLFQKMRDELGICYYVKSNSYMLSDHGFLAVNSGVNKSRLDEALSGISQEFRRLKEEFVPLEELDKAKEYLVGKMYLQFESSDQLAWYYLDQEMTAGKVDDPLELEKKIRSVTAKDIQRVAKAIFKEEKLNLALIGDVKNQGKLKKLLRL